MDESKEIVPLNKSLSVPQTTPTESQGYELTVYDQTLAAILSGLNNFVIPELQELDLTTEPDEKPELYVHPFILEDRALAFTMLEELMLSAKAFMELIAPTTDGPICPYQQTLDEFLGKNFVCPTINELTIPQNFSFPQIHKEYNEYRTNNTTNMLQQMELMSKEAADTTFTGITSENLGNAFSVLSGDRYILDKKRMANHLTFAETVRHIPNEIIKDQPIITSLKLLSKYAEISH